MKKTQGRQKIEIKKLEKKSSKQVTFSKRRTGLFKKASELSVLCGAEVAIIVFSPNDKVFCFGHPNVDLLLDRFLTGNSAPPKPAESYVPVAQLNREFADAVRELEAEKRRAAEVIRAAEEWRSGGGFWWEEEIEGMRVEELKEFRSALQDLRAKVAERVEKLTAARIGGPPLPALPPPPATSSFQNHQFPPPTTSFNLAGNHQFPLTATSSFPVAGSQTTPFHLAGGLGFF
ncbi:agamous-like MADS-box protein AGL62 [Momordica charantia]|uniref:Agamous-like MADS-box protein AGL62 n=1 Tax=Momordica charantia TaxID=3673 RepID=A0A6J1DNR9_MOMCH|nr:agamous-like MADS-box protein AGL62 [Momordica charantia]